MKKFNFKSSLCGFMAGILVATAVPVLAYNGTKSISATFKNIRIYIDGAELTPRDSAGNVLEPFIYNGSTYLPIRAVGEAVGKSVSYDANTNSVYLGDGGSSGSPTSQGKNIEPYTGNAETTNITMGGKDYTKGVVYNGFGFSAEAYYNLSGGYTSVSGMYGIRDGRGNDNNTGTIKFYGDDILLKEFNVSYGDLPKNFTINITGVSQLRIEFDNGAYMGIGDMYFK